MTWRKSLSAIAVDFLVNYSPLVNLFVFDFEVTGFVRFSHNHVAMVAFHVRVMLAHLECKFMNKKTLTGK